MTPVRWVCFGLVASAALIVAAAARADWDDPFPRLHLDHRSSGSSVAPAALLDPVLPASVASAETEALAALAYLSHLWGEDGLAALPEVRSMYAPQVEFYGSMVSLDDVMREKVAVAERWAHRDYRFEPAASSATCASLAICLVEGTVIWDARSSDGTRHSAGRARIILGLERSNGRFLIVREGGRMLEGH